eukprot:CAMPEP_0201100040 /NCGR_PEP_ID=MMETSP0812-20130820/8998_1 /ASSEMBLY_ACC=CAM_ASM_000668 /TAXON_ID=98059 /ORGANISM="Dinobryon sp., Strain UTEXLB2267" /LENGTH=104 /DNA_ID=CAMNT_0047356247 /DNA_START=116 /DNA_END=426 /DNA_ORIENTATION=+
MICRGWGFMLLNRIQSAGGNASFMTTRQQRTVADPHRVFQAVERVRRLHDEVIDSDLRWRDRLRPSLTAMRVDNRCVLSDDGGVIVHVILRPYGGYFVATDFDG